MGLSYLIPRIPADFTIPQTIKDWNSQPWIDVPPLAISHFHLQSSEHHSHAQAQLLHDDKRVFLRFNVADQYVLCQNSEYQQPVYQDSCVEFFFQPRQLPGYFNLEINCGGAKLMSFIEDATRTPTGFAKFQLVKSEHASKIEIRHSMPKTLAAEIITPVNWQIGAIIPLEAIAPYVGDIGNLSGQTWRANFFKCADKSSHPHWASWSPIGEKLNFHQPQYFGEIRFE